MFSVGMMSQKLLLMVRRSDISFLCLIDCISLQFISGWMILFLAFEFISMVI